MNLTIEDGYNITKHFDALPGVHPEFTAVVRPALIEERNRFLAALAKGGDALTKYQVACIQSQLVELNGEPAVKVEVKKLRPVVIEKLIDLIHGYTPEEESADRKN